VAFGNPSAAGVLIVEESEGNTLYTCGMQV
jgi:hypothetical protein